MCEMELGSWMVHLSERNRSCIAGGRWNGNGLLECGRLMISSTSTVVNWDKVQVGGG